MDLNYTDEDLAFRDSVRSFLDQNLPADLQQKVRKHLRMAKDD
ncbi:MAG TPA: pimeloyl-CoA dehydrogenase large subunit, partial [Telluria sp.]|nr:pimeloyl-CoA dehydrogenase large subunit [Telluria sp.]